MEPAGVSGDLFFFTALVNLQLFLGFVTFLEEISVVFWQLMLAPEAIRLFGDRDE